MYDFQERNRTAFHLTGSELRCSISPSVLHFTYSRTHLLIVFFCDKHHTLEFSVVVLEPGQYWMFWSVCSRVLARWEERNLVRHWPQGAPVSVLGRGWIFPLATIRSHLPTPTSCSMSKPSMFTSLHMVRKLKLAFVSIWKKKQMKKREFAQHNASKLNHFNVWLDFKCRSEVIVFREIENVISVADSLVILLIVLCGLVLTAAWFWLHAPFYIALWCPRVEILWKFGAVVCLAADGQMQIRWMCFLTKIFSCCICTYRQM